MVVANCGCIPGCRRHDWLALFGARLQGSPASAAKMCVASRGGGNQAGCGGLASKRVASVSGRMASLLVDVATVGRANAAASSATEGASSGRVGGGGLQLDAMVWRSDRRLSAMCANTLAPSHGLLSHSATLLRATRRCGRMPTHPLTSMLRPFSPRRGIATFRSGFFAWPASKRHRTQML